MTRQRGGYSRRGCQPYLVFLSRVVSRHIFRFRLEVKLHRDERAPEVALVLGHF
jgi:hypothetical protein